MPSYLERISAGSCALAVPGVFSVDNKVKITNPDARLPSDSDIRSNIESILDWSFSIDRSNIEVSVGEGWVTLDGSVDTFWKVEKIEDLASEMNGVMGITNKLAVVPTRDVTDESIAREIADALDRNKSVDIAKIEFRVENGTVTLSGVVPSCAGRKAAYEAALYTEGVVRIHDNLMIGRYA